MHILLFSIFLAIIGNANSFSATPTEVIASFEPVKLHLGQQGLLNITVTGKQSAKSPTLPKIDGLIIKSLGNYQSIQINNGKTSSLVIYSYAVIPEKTGEFSLANVEISIDGQKHSLPMAQLQVLERGSSSEETPEEDQITLQISINKDKAFVGQMIPVTISLYAPTNLPGNFTAYPTIEGDGFIDYGYKQNPLRDVKTINGIPHQVISFKTYITPLKAGERTIQYKATLAIQKSRNSKLAGASPFGPNLGSIINSMMNSIEEVEVSSTPININVSLLPTYGKPEDFTGAIGQFTIGSLSLNPEEGKVGDPMTLKLEIKGAGNMDRVSPPILSAGENWKTYPPKTTFDKVDEDGFIGTKVFEFVIIPQSDKITETPPIMFSFFNPESGHYSELVANPVTIKIMPSLETWANPTSIVKENILQSPDSELLSIKLEITQSAKTLLPLMFEKWFVAAITAIPLFIGIFLIGYKHFKLKRKEDTAYLKQINTQKAIQTNLYKVHKAYSKHNAEAFYDAAKNVILEIVARKHSKSSQTLEYNDLVEFLGAKSISEDRLFDIKTIFHTSDILKFSGASSEQKLEAETLKKFETLINELEKCS